MKPRSPRRIPSARSAGFCTLTLAAAFASGMGCEKEDTVRVYSAPKESAVPAGGAASPASPAMPSAAEAAAGQRIEWTLPAGWEKEPPRAMVFAAFKVSKDDPKAECTVTPLESRVDAQPGALLQNVIRWEGQLHLPPSSESDLPKVVKDVQLPAGKAQVVDLATADPAPGGADAGPKQHMIVYLLPHGGGTWFLKLTGPAAVVDAQKANFEAFVNSVKFPAAGEASGDGSASASAGAPGADGSAGAGSGAGTAPAGVAGQSGDNEPPQKLTKWAAPAGWKQDEKPQSFRDLSFQVAADDRPGEKAEVSVARLPGANAEALAQDVNMWRGQVGLEPVAAAQFNDVGMKPVEIAGRPAEVFEFAGPAADKPDKRVVVVMVPRGGELWFFKIAGSAGLVAAQKPAFMAFVNSAEFAAK